MAVSQERAVLAGGCFWGVQELLRRYPGVLSTRVGYTGGEVPHATYRNHGNHAEAVEIIFDPAKISYRKLLELFFQIHDPTTPNRQGNDVGASYRSAIFYTSDEQRRVALDPERHGGNRDDHAEPLYDRISPQCSATPHRAAERQQSRTPWATH